MRKYFDNDDVQFFKILSGIGTLVILFMLII